MSQTTQTTRTVRHDRAKCDNALTTWTTYRAGANVSFILNGPPSQAVARTVKTRTQIVE